ncbi:MAG: iron-sulfur cluster insertion protein ErpA [Acidimicrobiia bacterium]
MTEAAANKVAELVKQEEEEGLFLRVSVRPGGCSGLSYEMFFDSEVADDDVNTEQAGIKVAVDPASAPYLIGATLDYKDGLQGAGFAINNPNVTKSCGCGNSFS